MDVEEKAEEAGDRVRGRKMIDCGDPWREERKEEEEEKEEEKNKD